MKTKILLLFTLIATIGYTQTLTFDWETATLFGTSQFPDSSASQNINNQYFVGFVAPNNSRILLGTVGVGTTGLSVINQQLQPSIDLSFGTVTPGVGLNIQSIKLYIGSGFNTVNMTFKSLDRQRNVLNTATANVGTNATVVPLNWTNVQFIEISFTNGGNGNIGVDDIVFSPYTPPCVVNIPDANFKAALIADASINTNGDTEIQCSEATAFTGSIDVRSLGIIDLTGIEAFTNITRLLCSSNSITSIDVSNNIALETLSIGSNALTSIDVSNNVALERLYADDNALTSIDVSNNIILKTLDCPSNLITNLDVSANTVLERFNCNDNALTTIDVSANTVLINLECASNSLTSLNIANGNNAALTSFTTTNNPDLTCIQIDAGFTPPNSWNKDATASYSDNCSLSIDDFKNTSNSVSLYPNPTTSILNIEMERDFKQATIYSVLGAQVLKTTSKTIDTSHLKSGLYLIKIEDKTGAIATKRFIKE